MEGRRDRGREGGAELEKKLPATWKVLHAVPIGSGDSDIDHVVIGPGGVYTLNAKHHPDKGVWVDGDTFMVSGKRLPYIRNARFEAERGGRMLTKGSK